jgi:hypothetical protein
MPSDSGVSASSSSSEATTSVCHFTRSFALPRQSATSAVSQEIYKADMCEVIN